MTDDQIIDAMARAMCHEYADGSLCDNAPCFHCKKESRAAFGVAKPLILDKARNNVFLLSVIADIRAKSGVGDGPMLTELADAIKANVDASKGATDSK